MERHRQRKRERVRGRAAFEDERRRSRTGCARASAHDRESTDLALDDSAACVCRPGRTAPRVGRPGPPGGAALPAERLVEGRDAAHRVTRRALAILAQGRAREKLGPGGDSPAVYLDGILSNGMNRGKSREPGAGSCERLLVGANFAHERPKGIGDGDRGFGICRARRPVAVEGIGGVAYGLHAVARSGGQRKPGLTEATPGTAGEEKTDEGGDREGR